MVIQHDATTTITKKMGKIEMRTYMRNRQKRTRARAHQCNSTLREKYHNKNVNMVKLWFAVSLWCRPSLIGAIKWCVISSSGTVQMTMPSHFVQWEFYISIHDNIHNNECSQINRFVLHKSMWENNIEKYIY